MKISIHGDHIKVTEAIKEYIEEKITKVGKYFGNPEEIEAVVKVRVRGIDQIIEVTIPTKSFTIRAEESNEDLYSAIDLVEKKLEAQIKKNKSKIASRYKEKNNFIVFEDDFNEEKNDSEIIRRKEVEFKPMDEEEAILQMELSNHDFYVFKNSVEKCTSVVYKRKDGKYGIINAR